MRPLFILIRSDGRVRFSNTANNTTSFEIIPHTHMMRANARNTTRFLFEPAMDVCFTMFLNSTTVRRTFSYFPHWLRCLRRERKRVREHVLEESVCIMKWVETYTLFFDDTHRKFQNIAYCWQNTINTAAHRFSRQLNIKHCKVKSKTNQTKKPSKRSSNDTKYKRITPSE